MSAVAAPRRFRPAGAGLSALLFAGLVALYAGFEHSRDWNSATRLLLTYAIVQNSTVEVTAFVTKDGQLHERTHTMDLAAPGPGRYYCDKAPGQSFLAVVPYWLVLRLGLAEPHPVGTDAVRFWPADYWVTLATSGVLTAATAVVIYWFLRLFEIGRAAALAAALAYGLATIALVYATLFYGHASAGFCAVFGVYLLYRWPGGNWAAACAGAVTGLGVVIEYPQIVVPVTIVIVGGASAVSARNPVFRPRTLAYFVTGGILPALLLGWYHYRVTGSPLRFPYQYEVLPLFAYHREGSGIPIGRPSGLVIWELLFGQRRGLIWFSPVAFAALGGWWCLVRRGAWAFAALSAGQFLGLFFINAGFPNWDAGWSTGPRFLLAGLPLVMVSAGFWFGAPAAGRTGWWLRQACGPVAAASMVVLLAFGCVGGRIHPQFSRPFLDAVVPMLNHRRLEPHLGEWLVREAGIKASSGWPGLLVLALVAGAFAGGLLLWAWRHDRREKAMTGSGPQERAAM